MSTAKQTRGKFLKPFKRNEISYSLGCELCPISVSLASRCVLSAQSVPKLMVAGALLQTQVEELTVFPGQEIGEKKEGRGSGY